MKTIVGLFEGHEGVGRARELLQVAGVGQDKVAVLDDTHQVWERMDCSHRQSLFKDAATGAALVGTIYAVFGLFAGVCDSLIGFPTGSCIGATIVFLLIGAFLGAFLGAFIGRAEAEKATHLYLEGVRRGFLLMLVQVEESNKTRVMRILEQENALQVRICDRVRKQAASGEWRMAKGRMGNQRNCE
jgi:hypothetical protein